MLIGRSGDVTTIGFDRQPDVTIASSGCHRV